MGSLSTACVEPGKSSLPSACKTLTSKMPSPCRAICTFDIAKGASFILFVEVVRKIQRLQGRRGHAFQDCRNIIVLPAQWKELPCSTRCYQLWTSQLQQLVWSPLLCKTVVGQSFSGRQIWTRQNNRDAFKMAQSELHYERILTAKNFPPKNMNMCICLKLPTPTQKRRVGFWHLLYFRITLLVYSNLATMPLCHASEMLQK